MDRKMIAFKSDLEKIKEVYIKAFELAKKVDVYQGKSEDELKLIAINQTIKLFKKYRKTTESERVIEAFKEEIMKLPNKPKDYKIFPDKEEDEILSKEEINRIKQEVKKHKETSVGEAITWLLAAFILYIIEVIILEALFFYLITVIAEQFSIPLDQLDGIAIIITVGTIPLVFYQVNLYSDWSKYKKFKKHISNEIKTKIKYNIETAKVDAEIALDLYNLALEDVQNLSKILNKCDEYLEFAEITYEKNYYSPFWDKIENAVKGLFYYNKLTQELGRNRIEYYKKLQGKNNNFPDYPVKLEQIPNPQPQVDRFYKIWKKGLSNYEFSMHLEQRETRKVLIEGFKSLGDAIEYVGDTIKMGFSHLALSLKSDFARYFDKDSGRAYFYDKELRELEKLWQEYENERFSQ